MRKSFVSADGGATPAQVGRSLPLRVRGNARYPSLGGTHVFVCDVQVTSKYAVLAHTAREMPGVVEVWISGLQRRHALTGDRL